MPAVSKDRLIGGTQLSLILHADTDISKCPIMSPPFDRKAAEIGAENFS
jgi:hypothetical protein